MSNLTEQLTERRSREVPRGVANLNPLFLAKAEGALLTDVDGREYIDFAGGIGVNNVGHRHPRVLAALREQLEAYLHPCFHVMMYEPYVQLAERLNRIVPCRGERKTMLVNSGAEAVENAVKIARYHTRRNGVICFDNAFHGRTLLTMTLTSKVRPYKLHLGAMAPGVFRAHFPYCYRCPWGLTYPECQVQCGEEYFETDFFKHQVDPEEVAAIILEPIQGEGGFITPPPEYLTQIRQVCDRHGILLIVDEVQTGFGRTGKLFALEHFGVEADILTSAKSLAGGLPLGAVTGTAAIMDSVHPGGLGGTYGGNPLACRAALAVLEVIEQEGLLAKAEELGRLVRQELMRLHGTYELVGEVRGLGAMLAMELVKDRASMKPATEEAKQLTAYCREHGLIILDCGTLGNNIRTLMPLTITPEQLARGFRILEDGLKHVSA
ncbi:MAG TPA: 4-aminobutyrate--2-oxoglutarate transaminase [Candidatus Methylomirabilis sp.]|nr:4-aminobutyrate--2-oxoglutarate transaminase [Candidatus Methylomirabilis sp.]HSB80085.1 4-aminobutyrate--2-oxoglutarate transaminase [Candidatus Methylomirabilis sp.]